MDSQVKQILSYMRDKGSITNMEAYHNLQMTDLAQRIKDARDEGYNIVTVMEVSENGKRFGRYVLKESKDERR